MDAAEGVFEFNMVKQVYLGVVKSSILAPGIYPPNQALP